MKKTLLAFLCLCMAQLCFAQIKLDTIPVGIGTSELIKEHFLANNMILVGANFYGNWPNLRTFDNATSSIGMESGIFLSTGNPDEALQHPDSIMSSDLEEWEYLDIIQDIRRLHPGEDAQILELSFIPVGDSVSFDFVLASEHYEGLECMEDYDRLEVHLKSQDLDPQVRYLNLSHVPGKPNIPVNSNTVNGGFGVDNDAGCASQDPDWEANSQYFKGKHPELAFNGFTEVISTTPVEVIPYQQYTLIISLSEGDGPNFDSGLFLGAGSFTSFIDWPVQYEIINTFFEFCDTLRVGDLVITEEGAYFSRITPPYSPVDTFLRFQAYKTREEATVDYLMCVGDTLQVLDQLVSRPTTLQEFGSTEEGCDSITYHEVRWTNGPLDTIYLQHQLCEGDTIHFADTFLTETTLYQINTNAGQCDTVYLHYVQFFERQQREENIFACLGDTVHLLDNIITENATLVDTITGGDACDTLLLYNVFFQKLDFKLAPSVEDLVYCTEDTVRLQYGETFDVLDRSRSYQTILDPFLVIPDATGERALSLKSVAGFGDNQTVSDLGGIAEICITMEHSWLFDIEITLFAPSGESIRLQEQEFIVREHYLGAPIDQNADEGVVGQGYQYCWSMDANSTLTDYTELNQDQINIPAGTYLPSDDFRFLNGSLAKGNWLLEIIDFWAVDNGHVFDWSIRFVEQPLESIRNQGWITNNDLVYQDSVSLIGTLPEGSHFFTYFIESESGCYADTTLELIIQDVSAISAVLDTTFCEPAFLFGEWIDSSGTYQIDLQYPAYCESRTIEVHVLIPDSIQAQVQVFGELDTYSFAVNTANGEKVILDFGDGRTSLENQLIHTYEQSGIFHPKAIIYNACDTLELSLGTIEVPDRYDLSGRIETGPGITEQAPMPGVRIEAEWSSDILQDQLTDEAGVFRFEGLWKGSAIEIEAFKNDQATNGLDIGDLIKLWRHIEEENPLLLPHEILAADLNCDTTLTDDDVSLLRRFLLEPGLTFPDSCSSWIFWPQTYIFPETERPFGHPTSIKIDTIKNDIDSLDFYGLKRGDIGGNASAARSLTPPDSLFLRLKNGYVPKGEPVQLDFRVENFDELVGFQSELRYDTTALDFVEVVLGEVPELAEEHFGLSKVQDGIIRVVWLDILGNDYSLPDGTLAFGLHFVAKQEILDRREHIAIDSREFNAAAFNAELEEGPIALRVDLITSLETSVFQPFRLLQNQPNPFSKTTIIPFYLPKACQASLTILNLAGQVVLQEEGQYAAGDHREEIQLDTPGIYYYVLTTPWGRRSRRMILTK